MDGGNITTQKSGGGGLFSGLSSLGSAINTGATLFSDPRLKENIKKIGEENGFNLYEFTYIGAPDESFVGVMADEVMDKNPDAVQIVGGYMAVNYDKIGVRFRSA
jgi:hypothetical protein